MIVSIYFKGEKPHKQHFNVVETNVSPLNNEFSVHTSNDETFRYEFDQLSDIVSSDF